MDQMWKGSLVVTNADAVPLSSTELFGFQLSSALFQGAAGNCFQWKSFDKATVHCLPSTKRQTDKVSNLLMNTVELLAA